MAEHPGMATREITQEGTDIREEDIPQAIDEVIFSL